MQVFHGGSYGCANIIATPGDPDIDEPQNENWFETLIDANGKRHRRPRSICTSFKDGVAEVDDDLGRYLLKEGLVSAEPVPFARAHDLESPREQWERACPPVVPTPRKPPMPVGRPYSPEEAARCELRDGERTRL